MAIDHFYLDFCTYIHSVAFIQKDQTSPFVDVHLLYREYTVKKG
jgi:hypothetical protein